MSFRIEDFFVRLRGMPGGIIPRNSPREILYVVYIVPPDKKLIRSPLASFVARGSKSRNYNNRENDFTRHFRGPFFGGSSILLQFAQPHPKLDKDLNIKLWERLIYLNIKILQEIDK